MGKLPVASQSSYYCYYNQLITGTLKMPVNSVSETKKGNEKSKYSLSLNRNNAICLTSENRKVGDLKENSAPNKLSAGGNKENKPAKRPLTSTYLNTLSAAKRLKPLAETSKPIG